MKLVALKRLRYPRGPDGKEYSAGDTFETLSERDVKALTLVRAAKEAPAERAAEEPKRHPLDHDGDGRPGGSLPGGLSVRRRYRRRDLQSED